MKKIVQITYIMALLTVFSCADQLDLEPQQSLSDDAALSSDANVKKALLGAYNGLSNVSVLGGDMQLYGELLASGGEISWVGTFSEPREIFGKKMLTTNVFVADTWIESYKTINICNNILSALAVVVEEDRDRVEGEAKFIRGLLYFQLVRLYAKPYAAGNVATNDGVPIVLEPSRKINEQSQVARASVEEVYDRAITDLTDAEAKLLEENDVFATKAAASAILSRIYLQQENFAAARDAADRTINYGTQSLTDTYAGAFNNTENSTEDIFALQVNEQDGDNSMHTYWSVPEFGGRDGDVEVNDNHLDLYSAGDSRLALFYESSGATRSGKWKFQFRNVSIVRLAEMYLTRAEANSRLGTAIGDTPVNDVNLIRERAELDPLASVTLADILLERKLELAHEGETIHDAKRLRLTVDALTYDHGKLVFPIPQRERNVNLNLTQNDGYEL